MRSLTAAVAAALVLLPAAPALAAPNQAPVAVDDAVRLPTTPMSHTVWALDNDSDPDGDRLTYTAVSPAAKGRAYLESGQLRYAPHVGAVPGADAFTYTVSDGQGNVATATVEVTLWNDPAVPQNLVISSPGPDAVTLTWSPATDATHYRIHSADGVATTTDLTWTASGLQDHTTYFFTVSAVNSSGAESAKSDTVVRQSRRSTPTSLTVDVTDDPTSLALSWSDVGFGPYDVYRDGSLLARASMSEFVDTGLVTGQQYSYQVQRTAPASTAISLNSPSALSRPVTGTPGVLSSIGQLYRELGSVFGPLGPITVAERAVPGGRQQDHDFGLILQQDGQEAIAVLGAFAQAYSAAGGAADLGFPLAARECGPQDIVCGQFFEHGSIWSSGLTWATVVRPLMEDGWAASGWGDGPLGYPTTGQTSLGGGIRQSFQYGAVFWSPSSGSHGVSGPIGDQFRIVDEVAGRLGFPTSDEICGLRDGGCGQGFQSGAIYWSPVTGAHVVAGAVREAWAREGGEGGRLGYPTSGEICGLRDGGCGQGFQGGAVYRSPATGAHLINGAIGDLWARSGGEGGRLGYPTSGEICGLRDGGCGQGFQGGAVYRSPATGAHLINGAIGDLWARSGGEGGRLGYPTSGEICGLRGGGCGQGFQGGAVYRSPATGAHLINGAIGDLWARSGGEGGRLGYPTSSEICGLPGGGCFQQFQGGSIYFSPGTGAHVILGAIRGTWGSQGWEAGRLGYPTSGENCWLRGGGCFQLFQGGSIYFSPGTGAHVVLGAVRDTWAGQGWEAGRLGYPVTSEICGLRGGGCFQQFQGGSIYWSPGTGAHVVLGAIRDTWGRLGWEAGRLGYPVSSESVTRDGAVQTFQGGTIAWVGGRAKVTYR